MSAPETGLKVAVLGVRGIPNVQGGVETHAEQLYQRLAELGCQVEILVRTPFVPRNHRAVGPIRLRRIWSPRRTGFEALVHSLLGALYAGWARPDILHIHAVGPAIVTPIARLLGLRVVVTHHGADYEREKWGWFARCMLRSGERLGMCYSHARIAISRPILDMIRAKYQREADLIPNGALPKVLHTATDQVRRHGLEPGHYFLHVGRMVPEKRQLDLISAYALAAPLPWKLALVGGLDSSEYSRNVATAARAAGAVVTGFLGGTALEQIFSHAGAFVFPSSHEGMPIALLEALTYGLPVLVSDIGPHLEVGLSTSSYFRTGDVTSLAAGLSGLVQAPPDAHQRAERRKWVAQAFDWDRIARQTLRVYARVAETPLRETPTSDAGRR